MPQTNQISLLSRSRVDWAIEAARRVRKLLLHRSYHPFSSAATSRGGSSTTVASASGSWDNPCSARDVIFDFFADVSDLNASPSPRSRSLTGGINNNKVHVRKCNQQAAWRAIQGLIIQGVWTWLLVDSWASLATKKIVTIIVANIAGFV